MLINKLHYFVLQIALRAFPIPMSQIIDEKKEKKRNYVV